MRIDRGMLRWGAFFITAGAVPLAVQAGALPPGALDRSWSVWPLILVGIGIGMIFSKTPLEVVGGLIVSATLGLMVGGAISGGGFGGVTGSSSGVCRPDDSGTPFDTRSGRLAPGARVRVALHCGVVQVRAADGDGWTVTGTDDGGGGPSTDGEADGETDGAAGELDIHSSDNGPSSLLGAGEEWFITLPVASRIDLTLELNAGRLTADLSGARLNEITVEINAGEAFIDLRDAAEIDGISVGLNAGELAIALPSLSMTGSIDANAGSIRLCAPQDVALRLQPGDSVLSSQDFGDAGLVQVGDAWETPGYDTAVTRIELRTEANAGSFRLNPEEGCG